MKQRILAAVLLALSFVVPASATTTAVPPLSASAYATMCSTATNPSGYHSNYPVEVGYLEKKPERVAIRNTTPWPVDIQFWTICSDTGDQIHRFFNNPTTLAAYETRWIDRQDTADIWLDTAQDNAVVYDAYGNEVAYFID